MTSSIGVSAHSRALERAIDPIHVRLMVLVVMNPHRLLVDVRRQGRVVVGQRRNGIRHAVSSGGGFCLVGILAQTRGLETEKEGCQATIPGG